LFSDRRFIQDEANRVLQLLTTTPFNDCCPLTREFADITPRPGIYAFRLQQEILYIGKSKNIRQRLKGGHKALGWAFIERLNPDAVRIATVTIGWDAWQRSLDIEARILQIARPRYNIQIRQED
jgi:excinuclease UvrABC nuclease subunit